MEARVTAFGEAALLVELAEQADLAVNARVQALAAALADAPPADLRGVTPGYVSLLVELDPLHADLDALEHRLRAELSRIEALPNARARTRTIPTVYGGEYGPDLDEVAARLELTADAVIARHTASEQTVYMLGFAPGFPYLGDLPADLALPRRDQPRERVPRGSVAIAGRQTGIYSRETPGGWHLIGRTPVQLFHVGRDPPAYLQPADRVRFVRIGPGEWDRYTDTPSDW